MGEWPSDPAGRSPAPGPVRWDLPAAQTHAPEQTYTPEQTHTPDQTHTAEQQRRGWALTPQGAAPEGAAPEDAAARSGPGAGGADWLRPGNAAAGSGPGAGAGSAVWPPAPGRHGPGLGPSAGAAAWPPPGEVATARRTTGRRRHPVRRTLAWLAASTVLLLLVAGVLFYQHLNGNLHSAPLFAGVAGGAGTEKVDPFGRAPINILVIGSDTRSTAVDCQIGGGCSGGANADVEMVVHISADRSNATVMSVPRDTVTELPACRNAKGATVVGARLGQINSSLSYGPGCTVAAVHALTGVTIDHFVMVDFAGVIAMSDAVGGASVCVTNNVYDNLSQLKLSKGTHTLRGNAALEFLRSRHAFGDGSDLGRTYAQHMFLSAVIRNLKSAGTLANPVTLLTLADAATKALTIDRNLDSITSLLGLAQDLDKVPSNHITFTTMQTEPDPNNSARVIVAPAARTLFTTIIDDRSLTAARPSPSASPSATPSAGVTAAPTSPVVASRVAFSIENGSGHPGRATDLTAALVARGFAHATTSHRMLTTRVATVLDYGPGDLAQARALATALHLPATALQSQHAMGLALVVGSDWTSGTTFTVRVTPDPSASAALSQAHSETADQASACAAVSTFDTVVVDGVPMTPIRAYALSPQVPNSAR
jgi:LCP family protein required for cell wall assembly